MGKVDVDDGRPCTSQRLERRLERVSHALLDALFHHEARHADSQACDVACQCGRVVRNGYAARCRIAGIGPSQDGQGERGIGHRGCKRSNLIE